jgi:hypothetical protein
MVTYKSASALHTVALLLGAQVNAQAALGLFVVQGGGGGGGAGGDGLGGGGDGGDGGGLGILGQEKRMDALMSHTLPAAFEFWEIKYASQGYIWMRVMPLLIGTLIYGHDSPAEPNEIVPRGSDTSEEETGSCHLCHLHNWSAEKQVVELRKGKELVEPDESKGNDGPCVMHLPV